MSYSLNCAVLTMQFVAICFVGIIGLAYADLPPLDAPVKDPNLAQQGYSCQTDEHGLGLLKNGEERSTLTTGCHLARCSDGLIHFASCGLPNPGPGCHLSGGDISKPFPECCPKPVCDRK